MLDPMNYYSGTLLYAFLVNGETVGTSLPQLFKTKVFN